MTSKQYTDAEKKLIKDLFLTGLNTVEIASQLSKSQTGIERFLKRENLYKKINKFDLYFEKVCQLYLSGKTIAEISNIYPLSKKTISKFLKIKNINTSLILREPFYTKISNLNYFQNIDTEKKAWLLGFILADGNITIPSKSPNAKLFQLEIQQRDVEVLQILCDEIGLSYSNIKTYKRSNRNTQPTVKVSFNSNIFCNHLIALGIVPNKTFVAQIPQIPLNLTNHFLRGLIDGDGRISSTSITLFGNEFVIKEYSKIILSQTQIPSTSIKYYKTTCFSASVFKKEDRLKLAEYLYKDATVFLKRKANYIWPLINSNDDKQTP